MAGTDKDNSSHKQGNAGGTVDGSRTHFGYRDVPSGEKENLVAGVFHSVASSYDVMNDLMSLGVHRLWKRFTIELSSVRAGHSVLDIAGGTGDLARQFSRIVGDKGRVVLLSCFMQYPVKCPFGAHISALICQ